MSKAFLITAGLLAGVVSLQAQDGRLNFNIGGGIGVPLNPTADYAGVGGNFVVGVGENFGKHSAIIGQFMWHGLPPTVAIKTQLAGGDASSNLYALTVNYRYTRDFTKHIGWYFIAGGGWYYRHTSISHTSNVPVPCTPVYYWWGYTCEGGYFSREASAGSSALGGNGGIGVTLRLADSRWKFYIESRYNYAASPYVSTQVSPVTFGLMYQ
jgi:hypothetical protein